MMKEHQKENKTAVLLWEKSGWFSGFGMNTTWIKERGELEGGEKQSFFEKE